MHSPVRRHISWDGARVSDVARRCGYAKQSISYVVDDLQQLGYVSTEADPGDGRAKRIRLTSRGDDLIACLLAHSRAAERSLAKRICIRAVATLRTTLASAVTATRPEKSLDSRRTRKRAYDTRRVHTVDMLASSQISDVFAPNRGLAAVVVVR